MPVSFKYSRRDSFSPSFDETSLCFQENLIVTCIWILPFMQTKLTKTVLFYSKGRMTVMDIAEVNPLLGSGEDSKRTLNITLDIIQRCFEKKHQGVCPPDHLEPLPMEIETSRSDFIWCDHRVQIHQSITSLEPFIGVVSELSVLWTLIHIFPRFAQKYTMSLDCSVYKPPMTSASVSPNMIMPRQTLNQWIRKNHDCNWYVSYGHWNSPKSTCRCVFFDELVHHRLSSLSHSVHHCALIHQWRLQLDGLEQITIWIHVYSIPSNRFEATFHG